MKLCECGNCADFEKPILDHPNRLKYGKCKSYEEGLSKTNNKALIDKAYKVRGTAGFLYCTKRYCKVFKPKETNNDTTF